MIWRHVSELAIDRLLAGELARADAAAVRDHAEGCESCGALLADAIAVQRRFAADRPPLWLPVRRAHVVAVTAFAALAATAIGVLAWPKSQAGVRTKGTAIAGFYVAHGDDIRRGGVRETVMPGDRIELVTTTTERAWFAAVSIDGAGTRSVYVEPTAVPAGREQPIAMSIVLDDTLGTETVTGMFCPDRFDPLAPPADCTIDRFTLVKVAR